MRNGNARAKSIVCVHFDLITFHYTFLAIVGRWHDTQNKCFGNLYFFHKEELSCKMASLGASLRCILIYTSWI